MISAWLINCNASLSDSVRKNPIEQVKKNRFVFHRRASSEDCPLTGCRNRFARRKNPSNTGHPRSFSKRRNRHRNGRTVTTSHLLLQDPHGKTVALLPISQPNSDFSAVRAMGEPTGGGGVSQTQVAEFRLSISSHRKFITKGPTVPMSLKKSTSARCVTVG